MSDPNDTLFGVYVHWPFCRAKCPYCDFNSHVRPQADAMAYAAALAREITYYGQLAPGRTVTSIFFGGGTPSLMPPAAVELVLGTIARQWAVSSTAEITLEANPTSVEADNFAGYASAGVNRLSLGIQALNDADLKLLGREHSATEALRALDIAQQTFARTSFDLIYARPDQTPEDWRKELEQALSLGTEHLSLYQLTIEPGTPFAARHKRGQLIVPEDETALELYDLTQSLCAAAGMPAYEISNHARPCAQSRHNLTYWRYGEYVGIGPGAHGRLRLSDGRHAMQAIRAPAPWLSAVRRDGHGIADDIVLAPEEEGEEFLLMGLRLSEGILLDRFTALSGLSLAPDTLRALQAEGLIAWDERGKRIAATGRGRQVLNALIATIAGSAERAEAA
ncbi:radical SAM family heme chaperone HemW [Rhodoligotrophos ferricapiens]|uniref:radical SAM family heme chaperone HemW n=1 Tax=Rhodoligotrophos ferricapiens TaxID=3069264 RepID=UPI00315DE738